MSWSRNANPATLGVSRALERAAASALAVKQTYSERAKSVWRPASTGSRTCWPCKVWHHGAGTNDRSLLLHNAIVPVASFKVVRQERRLEREANLS